MIERNLFRNLLSLSSIQVMNYAMPLATLPFLARVLGRDRWGELALAEAYSTYLSILLEYGFALSATREIAHVRNDPHLRSVEVSSVLGAQVMLVATTAVLLLFVAYSVSSLSTIRPLLALGLGLAVARASFPVWYFQGMEQMKYMAVANGSVNLVCAGAIFAFVRSPEDIFVPLDLRALSAIVSTIVAYGVVARETRITFPCPKACLKALRKGWPTFLFRSAVSLYTTANVLLLGFLAPPSGVAAFAGPEKIFKAAIGAITPITQAFYPRISYELKNEPHLARKSLKLAAYLSIGGGLLTGAIMFIGSSWLVRLLLGTEFKSSANVMRLMAFLPAIIAANIVLGIQWLLPLRMERQYTLITLAAGAVNILLAVFLVPRYEAIGMTLSMIVAEAGVTIGILYTLWRRHVRTRSQVSLEAAPFLPIS